MTVHIINESSAEMLFHRTALSFLEPLVAISKDRPVVLGLCGGRSVVGLVKAVRALSVQDSSEGKQIRDLLARVHFFMVDERLVPLDNPDSNFGMLKAGLFDDLVSERVISSDQLHPFIPQERESDYGTSGYLRELNQHGGRFDGVVLGVGEDGHVAGLFPLHPALRREERNFLSFFDSPKPPSGRMTATIPLVRDTTVTLMLFTGEAKRPAWNRFNQPETLAEECPALFLRASSNLLIATDLM